MVFPSLFPKTPKNKSNPQTLDCGECQMKEGPDIALIGSLIGDPARANMLTALMSGKALTATELANVAGITPQTATSHLKQLQTNGMLIPRKQGRHKYFALADDDIAHLLETLLGYADKKGFTRVRTGPKDPALRHARVCYNHLAGELGVLLMDCLKSKQLINGDVETVYLTKKGRHFLMDFGIDPARIEKPGRPMCLSCLDWSERRSHLAGSVGDALLQQILSRGWARRETGSRIISFSVSGEKEFRQTFANA
ncbi:MAG: DNA-binding transcriptional ArsR family regulator [Sneathiella sp.]